jgi:rhodanese-related sulfurtransferase
MIRKATVHQMSEALDGASECQVIDVREPSEFRSEHIAKSKLMPLSQFEECIDNIDRSKSVYLMCRSGTRSKQAAERLLAKGFSNIHVVDGGIMAWSEAKLPIIRGASRIWPLERQVRFAAGSIVLCGALLGFWVNPAFYAVSAFVGGGLVFSALTDTCAMGMVLARMPWNR